MEFLTLALLFLGVLFSKFLYKSRLNPFFLFNILWLLIVFLSIPRFYYLYKASQYSYLIMTIGILGFNLGGLFLKKIKVKQTKQSIMHGKARKIIIYTLSALSIVLFADDLRRVASRAFSGGGLAIVRALSQDSNSILYQGKSNLEIAFRTFIIEPFTLALQPFVACTFWSQNKNKWTFLILDIIIIILRMLSQGSRALIMYFGLNFIFCFFFLGIFDSKINLFNVKEKIKKYRKYIILVAIVIILIFIKASSSRSGERVVRNLYYNFSMEPYLMGSWISRSSYYAFGTASLNGFVYPIIYIIKNLFNFSSYPEPWYSKIFLLINDTDQVWHIIASDGTMANAYVSVFWFPYIDGGLLGEFLIMFLYGAMGATLYKKTKSCFCEYNASLYLLYLQGIVMSFVRLQFSNISYAISFIFLALLFYKKTYAKR